MTFGMLYREIVTCKHQLCGFTVHQPIRFPRGPCTSLEVLDGDPFLQTPAQHMFSFPEPTALLGCVGLLLLTLVQTWVFWMFDEEANGRTTLISAKERI